jgi:hypothetical protein
MTNKSLTRMTGFALISSLMINLYFLYAHVFHKEPVSEYVKYRPVFFSLNNVNDIENNYMIDTSKMDAEHLKNVALMLDKYGHSYQLKGEALYIKRSLWEDKDYLANITNKANK